MIKKYGVLLQKSSIYVYDPILDLHMFWTRPSKWMFRNINTKTKYCRTN